jgi:N6-adenosine-specific RNA methylase IME4
MIDWPFGNLQMFKYQVVVADPPWTFELRSEAGEAKAPQAHYACMSLDDIKALPVGSLASSDCLLLLWTCGWAIATGQAQDVARAWGAKPITELVWRKTTTRGKVRVGPGYRARTMHEPVLLCTFGNPHHPAFPSMFDGIAREHSRKPDEFYSMVQFKTAGAWRCDLFSGGHHRPGFEGWGAPHRKTTEPSPEELSPCSPLVASL